MYFVDCVQGEILDLGDGTTPVELYKRHFLCWWYLGTIIGLIIATAQG